MTATTRHSTQRQINSAAVEAIFAHKTVAGWQFWSTIIGHLFSWCLLWHRLTREVDSEWFVIFGVLCRLGYRWTKILWQYRFLFAIKSFQECCPLSHIWKGHSQAMTGPLNRFPFLMCKNFCRVFGRYDSKRQSRLKSSLHSLAMRL